MLIAALADVLSLLKWEYKTEKLSSFSGLLYIFEHTPFLK